MGYCIANIECCEPTMLRVDPDVEVVLGAQRGMCAPVLLFADDRDRLVAYFKDQWGGDEEWTAEVISEIEEVEREGARPFGIFDDADCTHRIATVEARTAIEALDRFADGEGFALYSDLIRESVANEADETHPDRWLYYTEDIVLGGPFTNHEVFAAEVNA
jgi:hypothetical protein